MEFPLYFIFLDEPTEKAYQLVKLDDALGSSVHQCRDTSAWRKYQQKEQYME